MNRLKESYRKGRTTENEILSLEKIESCMCVTLIAKEKLNDEVSE